MFTMSKHDYLHMPAVLGDCLRINDQFLAELREKRRKEMEQRTT